MCFVDSLHFTVHRSNACDKGTLARKARSQYFRSKGTTYDSGISNTNAV